VNIVGGSIDLDRTAAGRQQPLSLFPGGLIQRRSKSGVGPDQERRSGDTGKQGEQFALFASIGEDADYLCWLLGTSVRKIHCFLRTDVPSSQHNQIGAQLIPGIGLFGKDTSWCKLIYGEGVGGAKPSREPVR
jgi:hypothetical protein